MNKERSIVIFNQKNVRRHWDAKKELWYFSVIDVIEILTDSKSPRRYWSDLKIKLKSEGSEVYEKIVQLKLTASDGKKYLTDCFSTEDVFRVIQSIPSPKAEPFKVWLAKVGYERIEETENPELSIDRAMKTYLQKCMNTTPSRIFHGLLQKKYIVRSALLKMTHTPPVLLNIPLVVLLRFPLQTRSIAKIRSGGVRSFVLSSASSSSLSSSSPWSIRILSAMLGRDP